MNPVNSNVNENALNNKNLRSEYHIVSSHYDCGDSFNQCSGNGHNGRIAAGLKFFVFVMLKSWRKSRREIKELKQSMENLQKSSMRAATRLHVYGTLIGVEQNRTDELTSQLKRTLDNLKRKTISCKNFSMAMSSLKSNQSLLEEELKKRYEEYDALNEILTQTKKQLFRSMLDQRNLHLHLCKEQRTVQSLENEKRLLITEIRELNTEHRKIEEAFFEQLKDKDYEINEVRHLLEKLQAKFSDVQKNYNFGNNAPNGFKNMDNEFRLPRFQVNRRQKEIFHSWICQRLGTMWTRFIEYPKYTLNCVHVLTYYLLPAMPSPPPLAHHNYSG